VRDVQSYFIVLFKILVQLDSTECLIDGNPYRISFDKIYFIPFSKPLIEKTTWDQSEKSKQVSSIVYYNLQSKTIRSKIDINQLLPLEPGNYWMLDTHTRRSLFTVTCCWSDDSTLLSCLPIELLLEIYLLVVIV
jgi:hypothetical protein